MTELALPAGSLQAALVAFAEGADAVYLGMKSFSARAMATNFSFEDLAKLRRQALSQNKKIYVTVNTLVDDEQLPHVFQTLKSIEFLGCDGVIVQDLGLVHLIKTHFPSLPIHGSTQLAVHTIEGVKELARLGFERVVLARELTYEEIKRIREACPEVQLKVFIHGALCYSVSGLCMASEQLCSRSANCGACAQICRNYGTVQADEKVPASLSPLPKQQDTGWFFSMSDLKAGPMAKQLEQLGIDSLKVEGRMKSPAYTGLAARYYRAILDGKETEALDEALSVVFSRRQTGGWLSDYGRKQQNFTIRKAPTLGSTSYPGHRGVRLGLIGVVKQDRAVVHLERDISLRDGLLYFTKGRKEPIDTVKFGVRALYDAYHRSITHASKGETIEVLLPASEPLPHAREALYVISRHDQNPALLNEALPVFQKPIDLTIILEDEKLTLASGTIEQEYPLSLDRAKKAQDVEAHLSTVFSQSDTSYFTLGSYVIENRSSYDLSELFIPLSALKDIRRSWYALLDRSLGAELSAVMQLQPTAQIVQTEALPPRSLLQSSNGLPFYQVFEIRKALEEGKPLEAILCCFEGRYYLPLSPIMFNEAEFFLDMDAIITLLEERNERDLVRFGLNNIGQVSYARAKGLAVYLDVYFYLGNSAAANLALTFGLDLRGAYLWMERTSFDAARWPFSPAVVDEAFKPPLFISRSCFRHDSLLHSCEHCPHRGSWYVTASTDRYHVLVEDCITYVVSAR
ncbi:MAG: peptidase U32 family protein [Sphaerochaeta sp.]|uniref:peptidase U32 family protein n=1 Tax=Sphaerochaeta sp. TaxID=1972642 RepID=UPI003D0C721A